MQWTIWIRNDLTVNFIVTFHIMGILPIRNRAITYNYYSKCSQNFYRIIAWFTGIQNNVNPIDLSRIGCISRKQIMKFIFY